MPLFKKTESSGERLQLFRDPEGFFGQGGASLMTIPDMKPHGPDGESSGSRRSTSLRRLKAVVLTILSGLAFMHCALTVHLLHRISPSEVLLFRTGEQTLLMAPLAIWIIHRRTNEGDGHFCTPWRWIIAQGVVMAVSLQLLFVAFQRLPLGDASALIFSAPAHVSILSWAILGERPSVLRSFAILGVVVGGVLVSQTTSGVLSRSSTTTKGEENNLDLVGLAAALTGTIGYSLHYVMIRHLRNVHFSLTTLSLSVQTLLLSAIILLFIDKFETPIGSMEWGLLSTVGLLGTAAHVLLAVALSLEEATVVASTRSLDIAVAYIVQICVCHEPLSLAGVGGASLISACVLLMALEPLCRFNRIESN